MISASEARPRSLRFRIGPTRCRQARSIRVAIEVYYEADSNTYILRLVKGARVLVFRLSEAQVKPPDAKPNANGR